ncbi:MAG: hypothetical protein EB120_02580 [Proteobacteria bacterium]|nr:hypothetical protein [Pseudomonadota bacterium]NDG26048.1 hypothetical protein [Pseudomonadota bacterium]
MRRSWVQIPLPPLDSQQLTKTHFCCHTLKSYPIVVFMKPQTKRLSTRQLLKKVARIPNLYRHSRNGIYYGITKKGGTPRDFSLGTTDPIVAKGRLREELDKLEQTIPQKRGMTLRHLIQKFRELNSGKEPKTIATNESILKKFSEVSWPSYLDTRVSRIRSTDLDRWLSHHEGRLKNTSYNRYAGVLRSLFDIALREGAIHKSPFDLVKTPNKALTKVDRRIPSWEEFNAIIKAIRGQRFSAHADDSADFLEFLARAGVGQAEACELKWKDIDFEANEIHLFRKKTKTPFVNLMAKDLRDFLQGLKDKRSELVSPEEKVFKVKDAKKSLIQACKQLNLAHIYSQRNLRQLRIVTELRAGIDPKFISKRQAHKDGGRLIMNTYSEVLSTDQRNYESSQLAKLDSYITGSAGKGLKILPRNNNFTKNKASS